MIGFVGMKGMGELERRRESGIRGEDHMYDDNFTGVTMNYTVYEIRQTGRLGDSATCPTPEDCETCTCSMFGVRHQYEVRLFRLLVRYLLHVGVGAHIFPGGSINQPTQC